MTNEELMLGSVRQQIVDVAKFLLQTKKQAACEGVSQLLSELYEQFATLLEKYGYIGSLECRQLKSVSKFGDDAERWVSLDLCEAFKNQIVKEEEDE